jgi:hypothetical protein
MLLLCALFLGVSKGAAKIAFPHPLESMSGFSTNIRSVGMLIAHCIRRRRVARTRDRGRNSPFALVSFLGCPGCLEHLIVLRFFDSFFDKLRALAPPFAILVFTKRLRRMVSD